VQIFSDLLVFLVKIAESLTSDLVKSLHLCGAYFERAASNDIAHLAIYFPNEGS
jgi:hypothetical protein